jgi:hypothetical protein
MSELMKKILAAKLQLRRELADLPFDKKLDLMGKMRARNAMLAENPLRQKAHVPAPKGTLSETGQNSELGDK